MKWLLITVTVLLVVAISVGATLLLTRGNGDSSPTATAPPTGTAGEVASANDTGPVSIITEDPTCDPFRPIVDTLGAQERNGWDERDPSVPATGWTPEQQAQYDAVAQSMRTAADQTVALVKLTPHRVMRELYEQTIAYWRAYADSISTYTAMDDHIARVANTSSAAIVSICAAIRYRSAAERGPVVPQAPTPTLIAPVGEPAEPQRFLASPANPVCGEWKVATSKFVNDTLAWQGIDPNIPATEWTAEQRAVNDQVVGVMLTFADRLQDLGQRSNNPTLDDFAVLAAQYRRAYANSLPSYTPADNYLSAAAAQLVFTVNEACLAAGG